MSLKTGSRKSGTWDETWVETWVKTGVDRWFGNQSLGPGGSVGNQSNNLEEPIPGSRRILIVREPRARAQSDLGLLRTRVGHRRSKQGASTVSGTLLNRGRPLESDQFGHPSPSLTHYLTPR